MAAAVPPLYSAVLRDMLQAFAGDSDEEEEGEGSCAVRLSNGQSGVANGQPLVVPLPGAGQESLGNLARWMLGLLGVHALAAGPLVELYRWGAARSSTASPLARRGCMPHATCHSAPPSQGCE